MGLRGAVLDLPCFLSPEPENRRRKSETLLRGGPGARELCSVEPIVCILEMAPRYS